MRKKRKKTKNSSKKRKSNCIKKGKERKDIDKHEQKSAQILWCHVTQIGEQGAGQREKKSENKGLILAFVGDGKKKSDQKIQF